MTKSPEELSGEAFARRGNALFDERVRPHVDVEREAQKFVAIDIMTGDYEIAEREIEATHRLLNRRPEAKGQTWLRRIGSTSAHHIGGRFRAADVRT